MRATGELSMAEFRRLAVIDRQLHGTLSVVAVPDSAATSAPVPENEKKKRASFLSELQGGNDDFYNVPTLVDCSEALLSTPTGALAAATAARCMHYDTPVGELPLLWSRQEWEALEDRQACEPIFDMQKVHACFDRLAFERDGYVVWRGIMTDEAKRKWTKVKSPFACQIELLSVLTLWACCPGAATVSGT